MEANDAEIELSVIKTIMEDSRKAVYDSGIQGIFWSILIAVILIVNYAILILGLGYQYIGLSWLVLTLLGSIISIFIAIKEKKIIRVKTFAGRILTSIWVAIGISNSIMAFAATIPRAFDPLYIVPLDCIVFGVGFYVCSTIIQMKFLKLLTYIWWLGGVAFMFFPSIHCLLFFSLMLIVSIIIPALQNRKKWKMEQVLNQ